ncbi:hypothetical protein FQA39_LY11840 [Lamprigera yunnana]|nr:hypothetical protein FQA39_LY11840 [Lamprigera yunnana]
MKGQDKIQILQEEELEEQTEIAERTVYCKEDKMMQMLIEMQQNNAHNSALLNKLEETRAEIRTEVDQNMKIIQCLGQLEELQKKLMIIEIKKFYELVRILKVHYQCGRDRVRENGNKYYNRSHYDNYLHKKYNYSGQRRNNHNYSQGSCQRKQFYYNKKGNNRLCERNLNINQIIQQPRKTIDTIEGLEDHQDSDDDKKKKCCTKFTVFANRSEAGHTEQEMDKMKMFAGYFVEGNLVVEVLKKNVGNEMNIIDFYVDEGVR